HQPSKSLNHPCCEVLPPCDVVTFSGMLTLFWDHDSKHQSSGSCVVAAAIVGIPAGRIPKNLLDRVSQLH
ncbi:hypothetical protein Tco_0844627, partial [Tanacetum coccineum]